MKKNVTLKRKYGYDMLLGSANKSFLGIAFMLVAVVLFNSCKKCYTCTNTCVSCTFSSGGNVLDTENLCSDSADYSSQKWSLEQAGYVCTQQPSTYSSEFCLYNKSEEERYMDYYEGAGRYTCKAK